MYYIQEIISVLITVYQNFMFVVKESGKCSRYMLKSPFSQLLHMLPCCRANIRNLGHMGTAMVIPVLVSGRCNTSAERSKHESTLLLLPEHSSKDLIRANIVP
uniref:Uncharacterized protein n=1 Tax=Sphaerodactylus townsendi TaxID=933632 RepID=A0ACB8FXM2_9SAUR